MAAALIMQVKSAKRRPPGRQYGGKGQGSARTSIMASLTARAQNLMQTATGQTAAG